MRKIQNLRSTIPTSWKNFIRNPRQSSVDFLFELFAFFLFRNKAGAKDGLFIIRLDAIGDYVLFRNFLQVIRDQPQYRNQSITLCANSSWHGFARDLDGSLINVFFSVDREKFRTNFFYRLKIIYRIRRTGYSAAIHPTYSRDYFFADQLIRFCRAQEKIGSFGDLSNMSPLQKKRSDLYYTRLIDNTTPYLFEFDRNKEFFQLWLNTRIDLKMPDIKVSPDSRPIKDRKYAVIFPGASQSWKRWPPENFAKICTFLLAKTKYPILICGAPEDKELASIILGHFQDNARLRDFTGKTNLIQLAQILGPAQLLVSNDTSAVHIAHAAGTKKIVTIAAGNHFGRFLPYPPASRRMRCCFPREIAMLDLARATELYHSSDQKPTDTVEVPEVIKKIRASLG